MMKWSNPIIPKGIKMSKNYIPPSKMVDRANLRDKNNISVIAPITQVTNTVYGEGFPCWPIPNCNTINANQVIGLDDAIQDELWDVLSDITSLEFRVTTAESDIDDLQLEAHVPATINGDWIITSSASGTDNQTFQLGINIGQLTSTDSNNQLVLWVDGKLFVAQSSISTSWFNVVATIADRDAQTVDDWHITQVTTAVNPDDNGFYIYDSATLSWIELIPNATVISVNGHTGSVVLIPSDLAYVATISWTPVTNVQEALDAIKDFLNNFENEVVDLIDNSASVQTALLNWLEWLTTVNLSGDWTFSGQTTFNGDVLNDGNTVTNNGNTINNVGSTTNYDTDSITNHNGDEINYTNATINSTGTTYNHDDDVFNIDNSEVNITNSTVDLTGTTVEWGTFNNINITGTVTWLVQWVTGNIVDNTDPSNPVVNINLSIIKKGTTAAMTWTTLNVVDTDCTATSLVQLVATTAPNGFVQVVTNAWSFDITSSALETTTFTYYLFN